jgi:hypothetical protein
MTEQDFEIDGIDEMVADNNTPVPTAPGSSARATTAAEGAPETATRGNTRSARQGAAGTEPAGVEGALARCEVKVPEAWRRHTHPDREFPHQCFPQSAMFVLALDAELPNSDPARDGPCLVHGLYLGGLAHGWAELPGGVVFDGVRQRFYSREGYYRALGARPLYRYEPAAIASIFMKLPHESHATGVSTLFGGWHTMLGLPEEPDEPRFVTAAEAEALMARAGWTVSPIVTAAMCQIRAAATRG